MRRRAALTRSREEPADGGAIGSTAMAAGNPSDMSVFCCSTKKNEICFDSTI
jgi:hypothetical protein